MSACWLHSFISLDSILSLVLVVVVMRAMSILSRLLSILGYSLVLVVVLSPSSLGVLVSVILSLSSFSINGTQITYDVNV